MQCGQVGKIVDKFSKLFLVVLTVSGISIAVRA